MDETKKGDSTYYIPQGKHNARFAYLKEILGLMGEERRKLPWMLLLFLISSLLDLAGLGLIGPYIALVINPDMLTDGDLSYWLARFGLPTESRKLLIPLSLGLMALFLIKAAVAIAINHIILRFSWKQDVRLRSALMQIYQNLPYSEYLKRNSSEYINAIHNLVSMYTGNVLQSVLRLVSEGLVAVVVLAILAWTHGVALTILIFLLGFVLLGYDRVFRRRIREYGHQAATHAAWMVQGINEGIDGFKEIRVLGRERHFHRVVDEHSERYCHANCMTALITTAPRYIFESVLISFMVLMVVGTLVMGRSLDDLMPVLGMFGVAALRLMPSANVLVRAVTQLRFSRTGTAMLYQDMCCSSREKVTQEISISPGTPELKSFEKLELKRVCFRYSETSRDALSDVSLVLRNGESIGLIGASGSGKTTMVDVILGLLEPQSGTLLFNGIPLEQSLQYWRSEVAYLPQQVFLIDNSLRCNVALGIPEEEIDDNQLHAALKQARLADVVAQMPKGVDTLLGERGVRLSGGQRQRVALARAFYHGRNVLLMDEATSALDTETEREIVQEIRRLKGLKTMIVIAHRLTTVQHCDRIYVLENGRIINQGSYQEVVGS